MGYIRKYLTAGATLLSLFVHAQEPSTDPGALPSIIPPSPEVAALAKIGNLSTGLHTGSASVNIPLYELVVGSIRLPIALSYSTNGTRTNDIPGRVGLGWNLVAGGSISRVIHDEEDDGMLTIPLAPPNLNQPSQAVLNYVLHANMEHYDTEADEYSFSVNGMSGKFFIDTNGNIHIANHTNIKITRQGNNFTLITAEGVIYKFGGIILEKTRDVKTNGYPRAHKVKTTAWFLNSITSPRGDAVYFNYQPVYTKTKLGPNQSVILKTLAPGYPYTGTWDKDCAPLCSGQWSPVQYSRVDYDTYYLSSISTSNGQQVYFVHFDRPDASGDNRLVEVNIYTTNDAPQAKLIKRYRLEYADYPIANDLNQRFFLKKLSAFSTGNETSPEVLAHQFEYYDPSSLGSQESLAQDYYGYSKGGTVLTGNFFPRPGDWANWEDGSLGIDRSPNFEATRAGTLKKIIYPTGGYEEFIYEQHTLPEHTTIYDSVFTGTLSGSCIGLDYNSINTYTYPLTVTSAPLRVTYTTGWNTAGPAPGSLNYYTPDDIHFISYLEIWKLSTNTRVFEDRHKSYGTTESFPQLEPGVQYEVRLKVAGNSHRSSVTIKYNPVVNQTTTSSNVPACGLRVHKINAYDPLSNKTTSKYYTYGSLQNPGLSSGVGLLRPSFQSMYRGGGVCFDFYTIGEILFECPGGLLQISSSALSNGFTFGGSPVAYSHVIESDDSAFANGGIEHQFYTSHHPQQPLVIIGESIAGASSAGAVPDWNGMELRTTVFKRQGNNNIILKTTENKYGDDPNYPGAVLTSYITRKRWDPPWAGNFSYADRLKGFDVSGYIYMSKWRRLDSTITTEYDQDGANPMTRTVVYHYNNYWHQQPSKITTMNSKGEIMVQYLKYPHDFSDAVSMGMVSKNIISPVIESRLTNNSESVFTTVSQYTGLQGSSLYVPELVKAKKGNGALENRLRYYSYDGSGHPLELSKEDGMHVSYLWNYQKTYPVAEVKNASVDDIAYTSFEGDDNGQWTFNRAGIQPVGITGEKSFSGTLTRSVNNALTYTVTLWSKSNNALVNGTTGKLLTTHSGWSLYTWTISRTKLVTVAGSTIDEVRLHPADAQMTTYTYLPFVGLTAVCDANNSITRYAYDGFNRLLLVRDIDNNILKQYDYKYNQSVLPCSNTAANWQETGALRCVLASNGNYTGEQQKQEKDMNTCSPTYLQDRWISLGVTGQCTPIPNCGGPDKRVVNGVCETGVKVLISSTRSDKTWRCMYKYVWSDGYESHAFMETNTTGCVVPLD